MRKSTIYLFVLGLAVVAMAAFANAGVVVSAQNTNSSTTMAPEPTKPKPNRRGRRGGGRSTRKPAADYPADASATPAATPAKKYGPCDPTQQEQTDLSGTYTGKLKHGSEPAMDATLTITGNNFTMATGADTKSGRITAVTTCGYTAVTVMMGDLTPPPPGPNPPAAHPTMSLRAKKVGNSLTLTTVPGEPQMASFTTGGAAKPHRKHRASRRTGAPPPPAPKQ